MKNRGTIICPIITAKFRSKQTMHRLKCKRKEKSTWVNEGGRGWSVTFKSLQDLRHQEAVQSRAGFDTSSWRLPSGMACLRAWGPFHPLPCGVCPGSVGLGLLASPFLNPLPPSGSSLTFPAHFVQLDLRGQEPQLGGLPSAEWQSSLLRS